MMSVAALANGFTRVNDKPPGWDTMLANTDMNAKLSEKTCHWVAEDVFNYLTTGAPVKGHSLDFELKKDRLFWMKNLCDSKTPKAFVFGVGLLDPDTAKWYQRAKQYGQFDHWFAVQTYGANAKNVMVYQGFCGSSGDHGVEGRAYSGLEWMGQIGRLWSSSSDTHQVPTLADELPMLCSELSALLVGLEKEVEKGPIEAGYNKYFAPPAAPKTDVKGGKHHPWYTFTADVIGQRIRFIKIAEADVSKSVTGSAFLELLKRKDKKLGTHHRRRKN
jgi:hypothetical protein